MKAQMAMAATVPGEHLSDEAIAELVGQRFPVVCEDQSEPAVEVVCVAARRHPEHPMVAALITIEAPRLPMPFWHGQAHPEWN